MRPVASAEPSDCRTHPLWEGGGTGRGKYTDDPFGAVSAPVRVELPPSVERVRHPLVAKSAARGQRASIVEKQRADSGNDAPVAELS